jgi:hypothetical protein
MGGLPPTATGGAPLLAPGGNGALGNEALVLGPTWASGFAYRLLAFLDGNGDGLLDPWEPRGEGEAVAPARGLVLVVR